MTSLLYAAVADDDTGAADLAGMFADQGIRIVLLLDLPSADDLLKWTQTVSGIVFATGTRALPPNQAYEKTAAAVRAAGALSPRMLQIKYCSTFDSTENGNIGPSLDAAMDVLNEAFTIALPALPVNGRTTYCGYHFVNGRLLSDSPMRNHPLTPMTDPDLVRWLGKQLLGKQATRRVGLTPYSVVNRGADSIRKHWRALRDEGTAIAIVDCLDDGQCAGICDAACDLKLITGGSAFGIHLPAEWRRRGWISKDTSDALRDLAIADGRGVLIAAGSCSAATARQNDWAAAHGATVFEVDPIRMMERGADLEIEGAVRELRRGARVLLKTQSSLVAVENVTAWGRNWGLDGGALGLKIAEEFSRAVRTIVDMQRPSVLIVAGGETATAVCRALAVRAIAVGRNIQPGVPLCVPLHGLQVPLVLKSGNFGSDDFYDAAAAAGERLRDGIRNGHNL